MVSSPHTTHDKHDLRGSAHQRRLHAGTVVKLGYRSDLSEAEALSLAVKALWHAADEDSATGGPDPIRGIYPVLTVITDQGFRQLSDEESGAVFADFREELAEG